jgi:hypothetical protein
MLESSYAYSSDFTFPPRKVSATATTTVTVYPTSNLVPDTHYYKVAWRGMRIQSLQKNSTSGPRRKKNKLTHRSRVLCLTHLATYSTLKHPPKRSTAWKHTAKWSPAWKHTAKWSPAWKQHKSCISFRVQMYSCNACFSIWLYRSPWQG